ncbi:hypothetical protein IC619_008260 [Hazenella sp. IB182353]|uniref:hypothetical protein n=1 Tax=Polycladospora coralii TaxID=2771432 RepID=UPI001745F792|nr:hypothetical protein [Polycladospora coralii]MBS7530481.1 hypothetical protein [Polycladospora coralii]
MIQRCGFILIFLLSIGILTSCSEEYTSREVIIPEDTIITDQDKTIISGSATPKTKILAQVKNVSSNDYEISYEEKVDANGHFTLEVDTPIDHLTYTVEISVNPGKYTVPIHRTHNDREKVIFKQNCISLDQLLSNSDQSNISSWIDENSEQCVRVSGVVTVDDKGDTLISSGSNPYRIFSIREGYQTVAPINNYRDGKTYSIPDDEFEEGKTYSVYGLLSQVVYTGDYHPSVNIEMLYYDKVEGANEENQSKPEFLSNDELIKKITEKQDGPSFIADVKIEGKTLVVTYGGLRNDSKSINIYDVFKKLLAEAGPRYLRYSNTLDRIKVEVGIDGYSHTLNVSRSELESFFGVKLSDMQNATVWAENVDRILESPEKVDELHRKYVKIVDHHPTGQ